MLGCTLRSVLVASHCATEMQQMQSSPGQVYAVDANRGLSWPTDGSSGTDMLEATTEKRFKNPGRCRIKRLHAFRVGVWKETLWAVRTAEDARDSKGLMGTGTRFMMALNRL